jgi:hypothetical protein
MSVLAEMNSRKAQLQQQRLQLVAERERSALAALRDKKVRSRFDEAETKIVEIDREIQLIDSARSAAEDEQREADIAASVARMKQHADAAVELKRGQVAAFSQLERAIDEATTALGVVVQLGAAVWDHTVRAAQEAHRGTLPANFVDTVVNVAHGDHALGPLLSALNRLVRAHPRLPSCVTVSGFVDHPGAPGMTDTGSQEMHKLRASLATWCSETAHVEAREEREQHTAERVAEARAARVEREERKRREAETLSAAHQQFAKGAV